MNRVEIVRALTVLLLAVLGSTATVAQETVTAVAGAGSRTCAQMETDIADLPNVRRAYVSWMQGYLSGRNAAREAAQLELVDIADYEAQWEWIVAWCDERPERGFVEAVGAMFDDRAARLSRQ